MTQNHDEQVSNARLNWLRAGVLGANDGIVSTSSLILGVAGATSSHTAILTAGIAGVVAGALSMAVGEYVSVSSQRDSERAYIAREKRRLLKYPAEEQAELAEIFQRKGLSVQTAKQVAAELTAHDDVKAHLDAEFNIDEDDLNDPWQAGLASLLAFTAGGLIPLAAVVFASEDNRVAVTFVAVLFALTLTGYVSAKVGNAPRLPAVVRVVAGGALAMAITYAAGWLFGTHVI
jgi:VIT1/CCC1 family predicted Fe2+/Mn2+ transporter